MIIYIDDMLLMAESATQVTLHLEALLYLLTGLGFIINAHIPYSTQQIKFLGLKVHFSTLCQRLPEEKLHHKRLEQKVQVAVCQVIGNLPAASQAVLILLVSTKESAESAEQRQPTIHCTPHPLPSSQGGTAMVARETLPMQCQSLTSSNGNCGDKVRCISAGMESSLGQGDLGARRSGSCT